jgi:hypothetical protein
MRVRHGFGFFAALALGASGASADATLYTPSLEVGATGGISCQAINIGKKPIKHVSVQIYRHAPGSPYSPAICEKLAPGEVCYDAYASAQEAYCVIRVTGGSHKSVRGGLRVQNDAGDTMMFAEARK